MSMADDPPTPSHTFPATQTVWISQRLTEGDAGVLVANGYIMASYVRPLSMYCRAIGLDQSLKMDADDIVHGFFASRLGNCEYLTAWLGSGLRLRQWLRNGLHMYVHETRRANSAHPSDGNVQSEEDVERSSASDYEFEHGWAIAVLELAIKSTIESLERRKRRDEWEMFWSHHIDGNSHASIGERFKLTAAQVAQRTFAVAGQLRDALREILAKDGASAIEIELELRAMMEVMHELRR